MLTFKWSAGLEDFEDAHRIRQTVFIEEQGFQVEFDDIDKTAYHVTAYLDGAPVATGRLFCEEKSVYHIGRVAVLKPFRGRNYGGEMMREIIKKAKSIGAEKVILGAQVRARHFYETLGFEQYGDVFDDEGCPHIMMSKSVR